MVDSPIVLCSSWWTSGRTVHTRAIFGGSLGSPRGAGRTRCKGGGALCVQMDFTRTFEANAKCNNINYV